MNRERNVAEFDSIAPTVQGGIPMTVNVNREGSACAQGPPYSVSGASGLSGFSHWLPEGVQSHTRPLIQRSG